MSLEHGSSETPLERVLAHMKKNNRKRVDVVEAVTQHGVNRATTYRFLSGDTPDPRISTALLICQELGMSVDHFLGVVQRSNEITQLQDEMADIDDAQKMIAVKLIRSFVDHRQATKVE